MHLYRNHFRMKRKNFSIQSGTDLPGLRLRRLMKMPHFCMTGILWVYTYSIRVPSGSSL